MLKTIRSRLLLFMALVSVLAMAVPAFAQSDTLSVDTSIFISAINDWLGMSLGIVAIGVGISGAFALATFVGALIVNALRGRMGAK